MTIHMSKHRLGERDFSPFSLNLIADEMRCAALVVATGQRSAAAWRECDGILHPHDPDASGRHLRFRLEALTCFTTVAERPRVAKCSEYQGDVPAVVRCHQCVPAVWEGATLRPTRRKIFLRSLRTRHAHRRTNAGGAPVTHNFDLAY